MAKEDFESLLAKTTELKRQNEESLFSHANVVGVAVAYKEVEGKITKDLSITIYVEKKVAKTKLAKKDMVPATLSAKAPKITVNTDVVEVGQINALAFTTRIRPAKPGYSIGHYKITAGTFGCLVKDNCYPCRVHILSNNHVLSNSNAAKVGDPILQPGRHDGGKYPADMVARLSRFIPIHFGDPKRYNLVDAALAKPTKLQNVIASVIGLGIPKGIAEATLGMDVVKSGRTTQTTAGKVTGIDATVAVGYGSSGTGYFRNQIITTNMSKGGDSGSLLMSRAERYAVGLLYAGSSQVTIHNNISNVLIALGVEIIKV